MKNVWGSWIFDQSVDLSGGSVLEVGLLDKKLSFTFNISRERQHGQVVRASDLKSQVPL